MREEILDKLASVMEDIDRLGEIFGCPDCLVQASELVILAQSKVAEFND